MAAAESSAPVLRVVRGFPTPEELAAVVAVVTAAGSGTVESAQPRPRPWADPARSMRSHFQPVSGQLHSDSWWLSGLPR